MNNKSKNSDDEELTIVEQSQKEKIFQKALGTSGPNIDRTLDATFSFLCKHSTDEKELIKAFWILIDLGYNKASNEYNAFMDNENAPSILKKYLIPIRGNRPIPDKILKMCPR